MKPLKRRVLDATVLLVIALILAACQSGQLGFPGQSLIPGQTGSNAPGRLLPAARGEVLGTGQLRVALLLPLSAPGNAGIIGKQQLNAARLAMRDFGRGDFQLVIKDTAGQAARAQRASTEAVREKSSAVLGPLFSDSVSAVSAVTISAKIPMIGFSSDPARARRGVYLMSFSPRADIRRALNFAISLGKTRFVTLLPNGAYGTLAENTIKNTLASGGARLIAVGKYDRNSQSIEKAVRSIATAAAQASVIYLPDGGKVPGILIAALQQAGIRTGSKMILGSGQWESADLANAQLGGAYFPGRDKKQFSGFASRYKAAFGTTPSSAAGLAYDAVSMAAGLARRFGKSAYTATRIESRNGYSGVNGIFRFGSNGIAERGLAVYRIQGGKPLIASPAPETFASVF